MGKTQITTTLVQPFDATGAPGGVLHNLRYACRKLEHTLDEADLDEHTPVSLDIQMAKEGDKQTPVLILTVAPPEKKAVSLKLAEAQPKKKAAKKRAKKKAAAKKN